MKKKNNPGLVFLFFSPPQRSHLKSKSRPRFDWADYESLLTKRGYKVKIQRDKENVVRGYSIKKFGFTICLDFM